MNDPASGRTCRGVMAGKNKAARVPWTEDAALHARDGRTRGKPTGACGAEPPLTDNLVGWSNAGSTQSLPPPSRPGIGGSPSVKGRPGKAMPWEALQVLGRSSRTPNAVRAYRGFAWSPRARSRRNDAGVPTNPVGLPAGFLSSRAAYPGHGPTAGTRPAVGRPLVAGNGRAPG